MQAKVVATEASASVNNNPILNKTLMIPDLLKTGVTMTKISDDKQKKVFLTIDPDEGAVMYKSSSKLKIIPIEAVQEIRTDSDTEYYRLQFKQPLELQNRWLTIIYVLQGMYKTLHIVSDTPDICVLWGDALRKILAIRQCLMSGQLDFAERQGVWERQFFKGADKEGDQVLNLDNVKHLCLRLNIRMASQELEKSFHEADIDNRGHLDYPQYQKFVRNLQRRPEIEEIYEKVCVSNGGKLDLGGFTNFMRETQNAKLNDSEIKTIFDRLTESIMSLAAFTTFLLSPENAVFLEQNKPTWQDMSQPISDYFVSSSHNTYLVGSQLVGVSTIEGYIRALLHGCRSVELDIYDGDEEPEVYHGKTLTKKVPLRDICQALAKYAFQKSPYPLIISAEVHCSLRQQDKLVDIMVDVFKDSIIHAPVDGRPKIEKLPSPEDLKYKFLLKAKNLHVEKQLASVSKVEATTAVDTNASSSSSGSDLIQEGLNGIKEGLDDIKAKWKKLRGGDGNVRRPKTKMSFKLASLLVYTVGVKCHGLHLEYAPEHIFSLSENAANRIMKANMHDLIKHTETHLVRVYPKGTRVDSSNYQPNRYWAAGCQVVAINCQTFDLGNMMNQTMFQRNGRAGYVLKPDALRSSDTSIKRTQHVFDVTIISAQQLPRLRNSKGQEVVEKSVIDPYVEVSLHVPEWSNSPSLPSPLVKSGVTYVPPTSTNASSTGGGPFAGTASRRTKVIKNNGFNPVWNAEISIPFDCVGNMKELIFAEFSIRHDDSLIGQYCISLACLERGFRHLPLYNSMLSQHLFSTLFVKVGLRDVSS